mmetsp:Transcript_13620/g.20276  ORF Transcript_13620/g.20276 Transcript_13620/m.20276 type:complete len:201 (-) Transcript_13620:457-1059(-)
MHSSYFLEEKYTAALLLMNVMFEGSSAIASLYAASASSNFLLLYRSFPFNFASTADFLSSLIFNSSDDKSETSSSIGSGSSGTAAGGGDGVPVDPCLASCSSRNSSPVFICIPCCPKITWKTSIMRGSESIVPRELGSDWSLLSFAIKSGSLMYPLNFGSSAIFAIISGPNSPPIIPPPPAEGGGPSFSLLTESKPFVNP